MLFETELRVALEAAAKAAELIRVDYAAFVPIPDAPASISTETDRNSQEIILRHLQSVFPNDAYCAEEATPALHAAKKSGPRTWIVDPIDGTRGFAMKNGEFSVMIGLVADGILAIGVVLEPVQQRVTYASKDGGCWVIIQNGTAKRCRVSTVKDLGASALVQSHTKSPTEASTPVKTIRPAKVIEMYSAGVKLALVARGEAELYVNIYSNFHDWDICAGHLLVTEAGGKVTALNGTEIGYCSPGYWQRGGLLATNGHVHDGAVRLLQAE